MVWFMLSFVHVSILNRSSSGLSSRTSLSWETLPGATAPNSFPPRIIQAHKLLHYHKVAIHREGGIFLSVFLKG